MDITRRHHTGKPIGIKNEQWTYICESLPCWLHQACVKSTADSDIDDLQPNNKINNIITQFPMLSWHH